MSVMPGTWITGMQKTTAQKFGPFVRKLSPQIKVDTLMAEALKNNYNEAYIKRLAQALHQACPAFDRTTFVRKVLDKDWKKRELKQRLRHITCCIREVLKLPYAKAIPVLIKACRGFGGYEGMYFPDYVEQYGLEKVSPSNWKLSLKALEAFTQVSSSEF